MKKEFKMVAGWVMSVLGITSFAKDNDGKLFLTEEQKALFEKALPDYDGDRFYVSHMKKVVDWYNELKNFASLDFVDEEEANEVPAEA